MIKNRPLMWAIVIGSVVSVLTSCKLDMPKETESSFETMVVDTTDIETPMKFSAKMKGRADVTISPQVSGQLMKIYVTEGQQRNNVPIDKTCQQRHVTTFPHKRPPHAASCILLCYQVNDYIH